MPIFQYRNSEGHIVEEQRSVADRDICPPGYQRITVPVRIGWVGCREDDSTTDYKMKASLKQMEDSIGRDRMVKESGYSVKQLQDVWETRK